MDAAKCFATVRDRRWPHGVKCPHCASPEITKQGHKEYESLFNSHPSQMEVVCLDDVPLGMMRACIASGLTHQELADRLQLTESAVQRYEQQHERGANFERLRDVINAIGMPMLVHHNPLADAEGQSAILRRV